MKSFSRGPVMLDIEGLELSASERVKLEHPACGGVILFARNYKDRTQLRLLCESIKRIRRPELLIGVDQEGGRVQRFRDAFTPIPPMRKLGALWDLDNSFAIDAARNVGLVIAAELGSCGVDFSFTPVLDVDYGCSKVIGDRAFHSDPLVITSLARALIEGLESQGMSAVGKHFPGHGAVEADTHHDIAVDTRNLEEIEQMDLRPFTDLCRGILRGVMPAHVIYEKVDDRPAGFSRFWLQEVLRRKIGFDGVIFSDDLSMRGARVAGNARARADAALKAGCDVALICNAPDDAQLVLDALSDANLRRDSERLDSLCRRKVAPQDSEAMYVQARQVLAELSDTPRVTG